MSEHIKEPLAALNQRETNALIALLEYGTIVHASAELGSTPATLRKLIEDSPNLRECWFHYAVSAVGNASAILASKAEIVATKIANAIENDAPVSAQTLKMYEMVLDRASEFMKYRELLREVETLKRGLREKGLLTDESPDA